MYVDNTNWDDCKKYFHQCFVKFKEEGERIFYITNVDSTMMLAEDIEGNQIGINLSKGYTLDYIIPKKTVFQLGEHARFLSRIPARMWKKGMNKSNTSFQQLSVSGWSGVPFDITIIEGFVNKPTYYSAEDAILDFGKSEHLQSAALSPRLSMSRNGNVYIDTVLIAKIDFSKNTIINRSLFKVDLQKVFKNLEMKVLK